MNNVCLYIFVLNASRLNQLISDFYLQRRRNALKLRRNIDRCSFYDNGGLKIGSYSQLERFNVPSVWDIEDIVNLGIKKSSCPYYGSRLLLKSAEIVFCPYNYIIDPVIRGTVRFWHFILIYKKIRIIYTKCR